MYFGEACLHFRTSIRSQLGMDLLKIEFSLDTVWDSTPCLISEQIPYLMRQHWFIICADALFPTDWKTESEIRMIY